MIVGVAGLAGSGKDAVADFLVKNHGFVKVAFADPLKRICKDVYDFTDEQLWGPSAMRNKPDRRYWRLPVDKETLESRFEAWHASGDEEERSASDAMGITYDQYKCWVESGGFLTPRYALQQLGSEWGRDCFPNTWVDYALRTANKLLYQSGLLRSVFYNYDQKQGLYVTSTPEGPKPKGVVISDVRFGNELDAISVAGGECWKNLRGQGLSGSAGLHCSETELRTIPDSRFAAVLDNRDRAGEKEDDDPIPFTFEDLEALVSNTVTSRINKRNKTP